MSKEIDKDRLSNEIEQIVNAMERRYHVVKYFEELEERKIVTAFMVTYNPDCGLSITVTAQTQYLPEIKEQVENIMSQSINWKDD